VALSSSTYKYQRRGCWRGGKRERAGRIFLKEKVRETERERDRQFFGEKKM
jgi:hypothetical protein